MRQTTVKLLKALVLRDLSFLVGAALLPIIEATYHSLIHRQALHIREFLIAEFPNLVLFGLPVFHGLSWYSLRKRRAPEAGLACDSEGKSRV